ncbi:MAG: hypothetical protein H6738_22870 [Alphaproteobacteria bacterium]|nr:hypothetical protein [Alphaproteobacteria bacterium]MCB9699646.1 hypothetical protein [Alphaproteobacteria bacterium]
MSGLNELLYEAWPVVLGLGWGTFLLLLSMWKNLQQDRTVELHRRVASVSERLYFRPRGATGFSGRIEGVPVEISTEHPRQPDEEVPNVGVIRIEASEPLALPVRFCAEGPSTWLGAQDLQFGEQRFDDVVHVRTQDDAVARALLDGPARDAVVAAVEAGLRFEDGVWFVETVAVSWDEDKLTQMLRAVARAQGALAQAAQRVRDVPSGLRIVARTDRHAGVRARALDLLVQRGIADRDTLLDRCRDVDVNVRLIAARALGPEGADTLAEQMRSGSRTIRVRAASALGESAQLRAELVQEVEDCLMAALPDPELVHLALLGLTRHGTGRSVEALKRAVAEAPNGEARAFARKVLEAVRARLDPTASGGLSIVEHDHGGLSEATDLEAGQLALARARTGVTER